MRKGIPILLLLLTWACAVKTPSEKIQKAPPAPQVSAPKKIAKNVILLITDGLGMSQLSAGIYTGGNSSSLERFPFTGLQKPHAANTLVTDAAAAATAMACGVKTNIGYLGMNPQMKPVRNLFEEAKEKGLATGVISSGELTDPTPAAFLAHTASSENKKLIAQAYVQHEPWLLIGGGKTFFTPPYQDKDLLEELRRKGYLISDHDLAKSPNFTFDLKRHFVAFTNPQAHNSSHSSALVPASRMGSTFLKNRSAKGFIMIVHVPQIHQSGVAQDSGALIESLQALDKTVAALHDFAVEDRETLLIVTTTHETGGFAINPGSEMNALLTKFATAEPTGALAPIFAFGPAAEIFSGVYDNTGIYLRLRKALGWP